MTHTCNLSYPVGSGRRITNSSLGNLNPVSKNKRGRRQLSGRELWLSNTRPLVGSPHQGKERFCKDIYRPRPTKKLGKSVTSKVTSEEHRLEVRPGWNPSTPLNDSGGLEQVN